MSQLILVGAYGRTYNSKTSLLKDWNDDLDFKIVGGPYINKVDAHRYGTLDIRFRGGNNLQHTAPLNPKDMDND